MSKLDHAQDRNDHQAGFRDSVYSGILRPRTILESIFTMESAIGRHLGAPLVCERQAYLQHLFTRGRNRRALREAAYLLLHVVRMLTVKEGGIVRKADIQSAANQWAMEALTHRQAGANKTSARRFIAISRDFFQFLDQFVCPEPVVCCFDPASSSFNSAMRHSMSFLPATIAATGPPVKRFLYWASQKHTRISTISLQDIDAYMDEGRTRGWRPRTIVFQCQILRTFFRYGEAQGWCKLGFARTIRSPTVRQRDWEVIGPSWREVRRLIGNIGEATRSDCRAKAILLLCSVYGLRNTEITHLTLDDFDWQSETFAVRRAKRGRLQQFPIQYEVGQAIIRYLRTVRPPRCPCRSLFVTLVSPYRPLGSLAPIVRKQMQKAGIVSQSYGTHSLRHACATELLRKRTALRNIADFLGHRDIRSVSIYAKHDARSLREVARFSLAGVL